MYLSFIISLFLLFSLPLFFAIIVSLFFKWDFSTGRFKKAFFIGMLVFFAEQLILLIVRFFYKVSYETIPLFLYIWITDILVLLVIIILQIVTMNNYQEKIKSYPGIKNKK